jgi:hypothetical protein
MAPPNLKTLVTSSTKHITFLSLTREFHQQVLSLSYNIKYDFGTKIQFSEEMDQFEPGIARSKDLAKVLRKVDACIIDDDDFI